jgi:predicted  nucleic acid-binding Zn-ribbon protein
MDIVNVGRELASTTDRLKKLTSDVTKLHPDYDELATQHRESNSENSRTKKELTIIRKKVQYKTRWS